MINLNNKANNIDDLITPHSSVQFEQGMFGACLRIDNPSASARISLFAGHLLSFIPKTDARERLWLSSRAIFDGKTPIRGGVPICWPWFGANKHTPNAPSHGFVRTQVWQLLNVEEIQNNNGQLGNTICTLVPSELGKHDVSPELTVCLKINIGESCEVQLTTNNTSQQTIALSQAIHSYFAVDNISHVVIKGVDTGYFDKLDGSSNNPSPSPYTISDETDRVHGLSASISAGEQQGIQISDSDKEVVHIEHMGHNGTVVWNPWIEKSKGMKDMGSDDYKTMLCIEAVTEPEILLDAGQQHVLTQRFY